MCAIILINISGARINRIIMEFKSSTMMIEQAMSVWN
jgi:hypothetical protein